MRPWITAPWIHSAGAAVLLASVAATPALAWPDRLNGRPEQFEVGGGSAYYIWTEGNDFHLATTGPGPERHFRAVLHTDGEFEDVDQVRLEEGDRYELRDGGQASRSSSTHSARSIRCAGTSGAAPTWRST
jgi:hypothetical protein